jgi:hypothetical protein
MSSPTPGGGFGSALGGLEDSGVDWHLLSPALHAQRAANIAGRKHGGAFSRKVVEEMVEKMEKKTAVEQAKGGPVCLYPFARPLSCVAYKMSGNDDNASSLLIAFVSVCTRERCACSWKTQGAVARGGGCKEQGD